MVHVGVFGATKVWPIGAVVFGVFDQGFGADVQGLVVVLVGWVSGVLIVGVLGVELVWLVDYCQEVGRG